MQQFFLLKTINNFLPIHSNILLSVDLTRKSHYRPYFCDMNSFFIGQIQKWTIKLTYMFNKLKDENDDCDFIFYVLSSPELRPKKAPLTHTLALCHYDSL